MPAGVVDVGSPGLWPDVVEVLLDEDADEEGVTVAVVEVPLLVAEVLSAGALGLAPPPLTAIEMPPLARTLTLARMVVVIVVDVVPEDVPVAALDEPAVPPGVGSVGGATGRTIAGATAADPS